MLQKLRRIPREELSLRRVIQALIRRLRAIPDHLAWEWAWIGGSSSLERLRQYHNLYLGQRCYIMGNGPSLSDMDLSPLIHEVTFGLNRIYLHFPQMGFQTTYLVCMNQLVLEQCQADFAGLTLPRFFNWDRRNLFNEQESIHYLHEVFKPHFSKDAVRRVWGGATVTFTALQLAYFMGFYEVILIGVDHRYDAAGTPHKAIVSTSEDRNHFRLDYFPKGFQWQLPDLVTSEIAYNLAREAFETDGRWIMDATVDGKLEVFPKVDYWETIRDKGS